MLDIFLRLIAKKAVASLDQAVENKIQNSKKFEKFVNILKKVLYSIIIFVAIIVVLFACWFFFMYFKGNI